MTAPTHVEGTLEIPLPSLTAEQIVLAEEDVQVCTVEHGAPHFGCPVCFLKLVYAGPLTDFAHRLVAAMVQREPGFAQGREVLADFNSLMDKVRAHVGTGQRAKS